MGGIYSQDFRAMIDSVATSDTEGGWRPSCSGSTTRGRATSSSFPLTQQIRSDPPSTFLVYEEI